MKQKKLPLIGIELFKQHPEHVAYMDDNIAIVDNLTEMIPTNEEVIKLDCFMIILCQEGSLALSINGQQLVLEKDYCALLPPRSILRKINIEQSYQIKIAVASHEFLREFLAMTKETWHITHYLFNNPIHPVKPTNSYKMYLYKELLLTLFQEEPNVYSKQTRRFHFAGMFCEMMSVLNKAIPDHDRLEINRSRSSFIVRDFLELINADDGSHRSVAYYADRLCYSPKYLSSTIKQMTGKSPLQIINEHAIKQIKFKLKHSNMSMKELADEFDFKNPSFFGKFVKAHTGMSPLQYRFSDEEEE